MDSKDMSFEVFDVNLRGLVLAQLLELVRQRCSRLSRSGRLWPSALYWRLLLLLWLCFHLVGFLLLVFFGRCIVIALIASTSLALTEGDQNCAQFSNSAAWQRAFLHESIATDDRQALIEIFVRIMEFSRLLPGRLFRCLSGCY